MERHSADEIGGGAADAIRRFMSGRFRYHRGMLIRSSRRTLGYHIVISGYGLWLPGDERGSWSQRSDDELGFIEPHMLHEGDPVRLRMAAERMKHPPMRLNQAMIDIVIDALASCAAESDWRIAAASIEPTHTHLLLTYTTRDIVGTEKWLKQRMTKRPFTSARSTLALCGAEANGVRSYLMKACGCA